MDRHKISDWPLDERIENHCFWDGITACTAGAAFGKWIKDPDASGLDFVISAMFLALLILQMDNTSPGKLKQYAGLVICMTAVFSHTVPSCRHSGYCHCCDDRSVYG
ncbi:hypothetical protein P5487_011235 [Bacillus amyloliquefaciens]|uniref:hypothetical protein n=1 Tax=Bacillus amyloliquefaciens TaxID=1390 RepID=UPI000694D1CF|nr:hypothetical protein [Bacillus amyloliquefaciens]MDH3090645.1 hypothetical protein [Bacillus amyloliquefaciens]